MEVGGSLWAHELSDRCSGRRVLGKVARMLAEIADPALRQRGRKGFNNRSRGIGHFHARRIQRGQTSMPILNVLVSFV